MDLIEKNKMLETQIESLQNQINMLNCVKFCKVSGTTEYYMSSQITYYTPRFFYSYLYAWLNEYVYNNDNIITELTKYHGANPLYEKDYYTRYCGLLKALGYQEEIIQKLDLKFKPINQSNLTKLNCVFNPICCTEFIYTKNIIIPPGRMIKVYEGTNTSDYKNYYTGVYDGNILMYARMVWLGIIDNINDVPDGIEI